MNGSLDLTALMSIALRAVDLASTTMTTSRPSTVIAKGPRDMVSDVDLKIEDQLHQFLQSETPDIFFVGEENDAVAGNSASILWVLDPVDGTANFLRHVPLCGVSLALIEADQPVLGVIDLPFLNTRYRATQGAGAFANDHKIRVSDTSDLSEAIITLGDYAVGNDANQKNRLRFAVAQTLAAEVLRVRMVGSAATDLAWLAEGKTDISVTLSNHPWDMSAGVILAREAGATIIDLDGSPYSTRSSATLAATPSLSGVLLALVNAALRDVDTQPQRS